MFHQIFNKFLSSNNLIVEIFLKAMFSQNTYDTKVILFRWSNLVDDFIVKKQ